jgi:hypothetical protein
VREDRSPLDRGPVGVDEGSRSHRVEANEDAASACCGWWGGAHVHVVKLAKGPPDPQVLRHALRLHGWGLTFTAGGGPPAPSAGSMASRIDLACSVVGGGRSPPVYRRSPAGRTPRALALASILSPRVGCTRPLTGMAERWQTRPLPTGSHPRPPVRFPWSGCVPPVGLEPTIFGLKVRCLDRLGYRGRATVLTAS